MADPLDWRDYPNFQSHEFACKCGKCDGISEMDRDFMDLLQALRVAFGKPMRISSGYRCKLHPIKTPEHRAGKAADILVFGNEAKELRDLAGGYFPRIGEKQHGRQDHRFIHLGSLTEGVPSPWIWTYP